MAKRWLLISIRPRFADAILDRRKRVEYRRIVPRCAVPVRALIYATRPVGALVGTMLVDQIVSGPVDDLVALAEGDPLAPEYERYLSGARRPCALVISEVASFRRPLLLDEVLPGARAPQSWQYLEASDAVIDRLPGGHGFAGTEAGSG